MDSKIKIITKGTSHLCVVMTEINFSKEYLQNVIQPWKNQLNTLSKIPDIQPHGVYYAYLFGFKCKSTFLLGTVPDIAHYLFPTEELL